MATATETHTTGFLTFKLGEEPFALDIGQVREVLDFTTVTRVPRTPDSILVSKRDDKGEVKRYENDTTRQ